MTGWAISSGYSIHHLCVLEKQQIENLKFNLKGVKMKKIYFLFTVLWILSCEHSPTDPDDLPRPPMAMPQNFRYEIKWEKFEVKKIQVARETRFLFRWDVQSSIDTSLTLADIPGLPDSITAIQGNFVAEVEGLGNNDRIISLFFTSSTDPNGVKYWWKAKWTREGNKLSFNWIYGFKPVKVMDLSDITLVM